MVSEPEALSKGQNLKGEVIMATIIKRKSKYSVVYYVVDENGVKRQKWESFDTNAAARKRKSDRKSTRLNSSHS